MNKKFIVLAVVFVLGLFGAFFILPMGGSHHPDYYVSKMVINPLPASLRHVNTIYDFQPSMGGGVCIAAYCISPDDFGRLSKARDWADGFLDAGFDAKISFRSVWPDSETEFDAYHFSIGEMQWVDMAVSRNRTKIIFSILH
jgi:hypothetical protein